MTRDERLLDLISLLYFKKIPDRIYPKPGSWHNAPIRGNLARMALLTCAVFEGMPISNRALAERMSVNSSTVLRTMHILEQNEYVARSHTKARGHSQVSVVHVLSETIRALPDLDPLIKPPGGNKINHLRGLHWEDAHPYAQERSVNGHTRPGQ